MTVEEFGSKIDLTRNAVYAMLTRDYIKPTVVKKICTILSVESSEFMDVDETDFAQKNVTRETSEMKFNVINVPLSAWGGFLRGYSDIVYIESLEKGWEPDLVGLHWVFPAQGWSMYKQGESLSASPGDKIYGIKQETVQDLLRGYGYVIVAVEGIFYKVFDRIEGTKAYFESLNEEEDGISFPVKEIKGIYLVDEIRRKTSRLVKMKKSK